MSSSIKIRYNTDRDKLDSSLPPWRILIDGVEHQAESVVIETLSRTSSDILEDGRIKWHISCEGEIHWSSDHKVCTVKP